MGKVTFENAPIALMIRGKLGRPNGLGRSWLGHSWIGDSMVQSGIYRKQKTKDGMKPIKMKWYRGKNNQHATQQEWRHVFQHGAEAWFELLPEEKKAFRNAGSKIGRNAWQMHMRDYLNKHKI
jgi:hypothetical protein